MFKLLISMEIFLRCPGLVTPMAVRSCAQKHPGLELGLDSGTGSEGIVLPLVDSKGEPERLSSKKKKNRLLYLWSHPTDGGNIVASTDKVPSVMFQLEVSKPLEDRFLVLK